MKVAYEHIRQILSKDPAREIIGTYLEEEISHGNENDLKTMEEMTVSET